VAHAHHTHYSCSGVCCRLILFPSASLPCPVNPSTQPSLHAWSGGICCSRERAFILIITRKISSHYADTTHRMMLWLAHSVMRSSRRRRRPRKCRGMPICACWLEEALHPSPPLPHTTSLFTMGDATADVFVKKYLPLRERYHRRNASLENSHKWLL